VKIEDLYFEGILPTWKPSRPCGRWSRSKARKPRWIWSRSTPTRRPEGSGSRAARRSGWTAGTCSPFPTGTCGRWVAERTRPQRPEGLPDREDDPGRTTSPAPLGSIHPSAWKVDSRKFTPCLQTRGGIPMTYASSDLNDPCSRNHSCTPHVSPGRKVANASGRWGSALLVFFSSP
jgi:hypothetical protein